jgi:hypothetical protein
VVAKLYPTGALPRIGAMVQSMGDVLKLIWWAVIALFRLRASLEAEILALRRQLTVPRRKAPNTSRCRDFKQCGIKMIWEHPRSLGGIGFGNRERNLLST